MLINLNFKKLLYIYILILKNRVFSTHFETMGARSMQSEDFVVHLNNFSDSSLYSNTSASFTNLIQPQILLPYHTPYEVGLTNIFFKENIYPILQDDDESNIKLLLYRINKLGKQDESKKQESYSIQDEFIIGDVIPKSNIISDITKVLAEYNTQLGVELFSYDELNMQIQFNNIAGVVEMFLTKLIKSNVNIQSLWMDGSHNLLVSRNQELWLGLKFGRRIGNYLGFTPHKPIIICDLAKPELVLSGGGVWNFLNKDYITHPNLDHSGKGLINNIFVYCDAIRVSRTGSQNTHLLEIVPVNTFSKPNSITVYKELSKYDISSISITLTDEYGKPIAFLNNTYVAVNLHFKPKV